MKMDFTQEKARFDLKEKIVAEMYSYNTKYSSVVNLLIS